MTQAVKAAALGIDEKALVFLGACGERAPFKPKLVLVLVSYCYARQFYSSAAIESWLRSDLSFRQLFGAEIPDARMISALRATNRDALHRCLVAGLRFLAEQKVAQGLVTRVSETQLVEEANRRIIMATFTDTMEQERHQPRERSAEISYLFAKGRGPVH